MSEYMWEFLGRPDKDGHRFWKDVDSGNIALSDESGDGPHGHVGRPEETDDGVLFFDTEAMPELYVSSIGGVYVSVPLLHTDRTDPHCHTGVSAKAFLWLVKQGHWPDKALRVNQELKEVAELFETMSLVEDG
jgi:hypothetical protein